MNHKNRFLINHTGFLPEAPKKFVYDGNADSFTVCRLQDLKLTPVFEGSFEWRVQYGSYGVGDFSGLCEEGIYRIHTEDGNSRCFVIWENAYDPLARILLNFFVWQRCGDEQGWNGACHTGDHILLRSSQMRSLTGGFHQSSDLRKWVFGTTLGLSALAEYALEAEPARDQKIIGENLWHGAKYLLSLITEEGWLIDCTWIPEGYNTKLAGKGYGDYRFSWKNRQYYESPNNEPSHWQTIKFLALASRYFKESDAGKSEECLVGAKAVWRYMLGPGSEMQNYDLPAYPPLGHDGMARQYRGYYQGSALRCAELAGAAIKLFDAEPCMEYHDEAVLALRQLSKLQVGGDVSQNPAAACFWEGEHSDFLANNYYYFFSTSVPIVLLEAAETWPDDPDAAIWQGCARLIAEQHNQKHRENPFGRVPATWHTAGHDRFETPVIFSYSTEHDASRDETKGGIASKGNEDFEVLYKEYSFCYNLDLIAAGVFLTKAAKHFGEPEYTQTAQRQLDWILGANRFDASNVEGVGYNQPHRGIFGEFFPPVPQIPGAVFTGITEESFVEESYGLDNEYDMPMVGWMLYLVSQIDGNKNKR